MDSKIIDLTIPIHDGMGRLGLNVKFEKCVTFEDKGWQGSIFSMFAHLGTHVDAPIHFIEGTYGVNQIPLDRLIGSAVVMNFSHKEGGEAITREEVEAFDNSLKVKEGEIVIFRTDWTDKKWGTSEFFDNSPYVTAEVGEWMAEKKVKAGVFDFSEEFNVRYPGFEGKQCPYHNAVLSSDVYNIEYVKNLSLIKSTRCLIIATPLNLVDFDGAPARVIAIEPDNIESVFSIAASEIE